MSFKNKLEFTLFDILGDVQNRAESRNKFNISIVKYYMGKFSIPLISLL